MTVLTAGVAAAGCDRAATVTAEPAVPLASTGRCQVIGPGPGGTGGEPGADPSDERDRLRAACERALPVVTQVWPGWTGTAHIEVSPTALDAGTAAHVVGFARDGEPARDDRIVVAPGLTGELSPAGIDVVLRHELTHLAMRSTGTAPLPLWASEGLAIHLGYASVDGPRRERRPELERLRARVESESWTGTVPGSALFEDSADRSDAYSAAWLGIEVLIERLGRDRLVDAMAPQAGEPSLADVATALTGDERTEQFLGSLGVSRQWMEERWRAELVLRTS
ncbi:MAG: hypothetical protein ABR500_15425 [Dermatophilaceae bacterium]|nr:hypothetical protein [Intrasporangiaceae bacterium]